MSCDLLLNFLASSDIRAQILYEPTPKKRDLVEMA
jgi:hypothetical protein